MRNITWTCWFQGRNHAPELVQKCLRSWEDQNPGWDVRCLDASSALHYAPALVNFDLTKRDVAAASLSDDLRISVLHEFGGVWVDATLLCNRPLDEWLPGAFGEGFFAFDTPDHGRLWRAGSCRQSLDTQRLPVGREPSRNVGGSARRPTNTSGFTGFFSASARPIRRPDRTACCGV